LRALPESLDRAEAYECDVDNIVDGSSDRRDAQTRPRDWRVAGFAIFVKTLNPSNYSPREKVNPSALLPDNEIVEVEPPPIRSFVIDALFAVASAQLATATMSSV
jgi:hypothetical protein